MLFNSLEFLIFFPLVVGAYFLIPAKVRWIFMLGASYYFYMCWKAEYIVLIFISTLIDYFAARKIAQSKSGSTRKALLTISLLTNLGLLFSFKYFNFFNENIQSLFDSLNLFYDIPELKLLLPVGISFYTFQTLSYTIDVYNDKIKPEKHFGYFALYVSYWPQLVAGPIERAGRLLPQIREKHNFKYERISDGLKMMLWGFFKKVVIADRLAIFVDQVYDNPTGYQGLGVIIATIFFAFQIYCDFSGYSDIAIGVSKIMGIELMTNFKRPYFSKDISEFWKRWHISLSTWFRDYVYIPLGGNRTVKWRWYYNLLITFLVSGFWHGANWTFITWGAIHGFYLIAAIILGSLINRINNILCEKLGNQFSRFINMITTFILVCFAWVFFRADSLEHAWSIFNSMNASTGWSITTLLEINEEQFYYAIIFLIILTLIEAYQRKYENIADTLTSKPLWMRWSFYNLLFLSILFFGIYSNKEFIYFQF